MSQSKPARVPLSDYAREVLHERLAPRERPKWEDIDSRDFIGALARDIARDVFEDGPTPLPSPDGIFGLATADCITLGSEFVDVALDATQPPALRVRAALGLVACVALKCVSRETAETSRPTLRDVLADLAGCPWLPASAASVVREALTGVDRRPEAARAFVIECRAELARTWGAAVDVEHAVNSPAPPVPSAMGGARPSKSVVQLGERDRLRLGEDYLTWQRRDRGKPRTRSVTLGGPEGRVLLALVHGCPVPYQKEPRAHVKAALAARGIHVDGIGESVRLRERLTLGEGVLDRFREIHPGEGI